MARAALLYPQRQRCRACRRCWSFDPPLRGLYCSPECAGRPEVPLEDVNGVLVPPRTCRSKVVMNGPNSRPRFSWKRVFATEAEALAFGRRNGTPTAYECPNCWWWHVASDRSRRHPKEDS